LEIKTEDSVEAIKGVEAKLEIARISDLQSITIEWRILLEITAITEEEVVADEIE